MTIKCMVCQKSFNQITSQHLKTHSLNVRQYRILYPDSKIVTDAIYQKIRSGGGCQSAKDARRKITIDQQEEYSLSLNFCACCSKTLTYEQRKNRFCSNSCSSKITNQEKDWSKIKTGPRRKDKPEFSKLRICTCRTCNVSFVNRTSVLYCKDHRGTTGRYQDWYRFKFNVFHYPDLFDLEIIKKIGFYNSSNREGLARDHRISIYEAMTNNYDKFYITHPLNCQIILQKENSKKENPLIYFL